MLIKMRGLSVLLVAGLLMIPTTSTASAAFDPSYLLPDFELFDWQSMDYHAIEDFLLRKNSTLAAYVDPSTRQLAAQIIADASMVYQINPKVLLVLLQKEQSLIEDPLPSQGQYDWAAGYAVCDSCSKSDPAIQKFKGFGVQVDRAAWRLRYYIDHPDEFQFKTGAIHAIDGQAVLMSNDATRAFYTYTPHLHGNENFVRIWQRWFARDYPDGAVLRERDRGHLWLIQGGKRRRFASIAVAASRANLDAVIPASSADIQKYEEGPPIIFAEYTLLRSPRGTVYLYINDTIRGMESQEVFRSLGFNPEEVVDASWDDLAQIHEGAPITMRSAYPVGALLQDVKSGGVWYVQDGIKHALYARELLTNFSGKKILKADEAQLAQYTTGEPVRLKDGTLIKRASAPDVAVIANGMRRGFTSWDVFMGLGYHPDTIITVPDRVWDMHEEGPLVELPHDDEESGSAGEIQEALSRF